MRYQDKLEKMASLINMGFRPKEAYKVAFGEEFKDE